MIDLSTIVLISSLLFGSVIADSVLFGKTLRFDASVPTAVANDGLSVGSAEKLFVSELTRLSRAESVIPFPDVSDGMEGGVLSTLAKPLHMDAALDVLQRKINANNTTITFSVIKGPNEGELSVHAFVMSPSGQMSRTSLSGSSKDPAGLVMATSREIISKFLPYRLALAEYAAGVKGEADAFARAERLAQRALSEQGEDVIGAPMDRADRQIMMHNCLGLMALLKGDQAKAMRHFDQARAIPASFTTTHAIVAANQAFTALGRKDMFQARQYLGEAQRLRMSPYSHHFDGDLRVLEALVLWGEGKLQAADELLESEGRDKIHAASTYYRSRIAAQRGEVAVATELARRADVEGPFAAFHADLAQAALWVDPHTGSLVRRPR